MDNGKDCYLRFLAGDEDGLVGLLRLYRSGLILYVNTFTHNIFDAEDVVQDVFVKLCLKKPRYRDSASFKTWLYTIARNKALDFLRKKNAHDAPEAIDDADLADEEAAVEESYLQQEKQQLVREAMRALKPEYAQVLFLTYFEDLSNQQTAKIMKRSVHSVETLNYRARKALKLLLEQEDV